eukprot:15464945-Alexandrium_andersonii.AAC.1
MVARRGTGGEDNMCRSRCLRGCACGRSSCVQRAEARFESCFCGRAGRWAQGLLPAASRGPTRAAGGA